MNNQSTHLSHFTTYAMEIKIDTNQTAEKSFLEKVIEQHEKPVKREETLQDIRKAVIGNASNIIPTRPKATTL